MLSFEVWAGSNDQIDGVIIGHNQYGEAEAFCAKLNQWGLVDAVLTPDGDAFLFGADTVFTQYSATAPTITCSRTLGSALNQRKLVALGLLLGTDYSDGVKGIGYKRAGKLLDRALRAYAVDLDGPHSDWLSHIERWVEMEEEALCSLFRGRSPRDKVLEKFIVQIRAKYHDTAHLRDVVDAFLRPHFAAADEQRLRDRQWMKWRCPSIRGVMRFAASLGFSASSTVRHALDIAFDLIAYGLADDDGTGSGAVFEMEHIVKERVRSKVAMYGVKWRCNDRGLSQFLFGDPGSDLAAVKMEGLHCVEAMDHLHPEMAEPFKVKMRRHVD